MVFTIAIALLKGFGESFTQLPHFAMSKVWVFVARELGYPAVVPGERGFL